MLLRIHIWQVVTDNPATTPKPDGDGHSKDDILNAAQKTTVKLFENNGCSGNELEFKVSHPEQNCKYCLDTCNERFTTDPSIDAHLKVKSVMIYDDQDCRIKKKFLWFVQNKCINLQLS